MYRYTRLSDHKNANCFVIENGRDAVLVSYSTPVIHMEYKGGKRYMTCTGTYSATTRKHIGYFLREYARDLCYYDMKNIVGKGAVEL